ncbi:flagellar motor switch protein [Buchnera aphidicola (Cinara tujafilina)]|uniref:Flagellar motor switch protein FliG n=1 Tax=Buchnera aphidicola (Cinara tujafilina) TaxID=261317 RepID=F7WYY6_9GAMM|nr:FliG C-terminal domain-containing protein [Buchnera aphidicola]AEH39636.1 flagellar motor switch protein [Buchnera aphidicola (Cinara tujafilina)]
MKLNNIQKSALFLMSIDINEAVQTLEYFSEKEIFQLTQAMLSLDTRESYNISNIKKEFYYFLKENNISYFNIQKNISVLIQKRLGKKKGCIFLQDSLLKMSIQKKIVFLEKLDIHDLFFLIFKEHEQIITVLLIYFSKLISAKLLLLFNFKKRSIFLIGIENFIALSKKGLLEFNKILRNLIEKYTKSVMIKKNTKHIVGILQSFDKKNIKDILNNINRVDKKLVYKINSLLFDWSDLINISDYDIKFIIQNIDIKILYKGLKEIDDVIINRFYKNFSELQKKYFYKKNIKIKIFLMFNSLYLKKII